MAPKKIEKELPPQIEKLVKNGTPPLVPRKDEATLEEEVKKILEKNHISTAGN